jgi:hypothetical protein
VINRSPGGASARFADQNVGNSRSNCLANGDADANNVLVRPAGPADARLIDFEFVGYAHTVTDAVCLYVPGPGWMAVGHPVAAGLADAYRAALAEGVPEAAGDRRYGLGWRRPVRPGRWYECTGSPSSTPAPPATTAGHNWSRPSKRPPARRTPTTPCPNGRAGPTGWPGDCAAAGRTRTATSRTRRPSRRTRRGRVSVRNGRSVCPRRGCGRSGRGVRRRGRRRWGGRASCRWHRPRRRSGGGCPWAGRGRRSRSS